MNRVNSSCSHCGVVFEQAEGYPRHCVAPSCGAVTYVNPTPVAVVLVPVQYGERVGLLSIRRGVEPCIGKLAIVGGFVDAEERWQDAAAREVYEEAGVRVDAESIEPFWFTSTEPRPNRVLLFGVAKPIAAATLPAFEATNETTERGLIFGPQGLDEVFAFSLHTKAAARWFASKNVTIEHGFVAL